MDTNGHILASTKFSAFQNWIQLPSPDFYFYIKSIVLSGDYIYVGGSGLNNFYFTNDNGNKWNHSVNGPGPEINKLLIISDTDFFAGTNSGIFHSNDKGLYWSSAGSGPIGNIKINDLVNCGSNLYAATLEGIFCSTNTGKNWTQVNSGLSDTNITSLAVSGTKIFAGTSLQRDSVYIDKYNFWYYTEKGQGVFLSTNNGASWAPVNTGLITQSEIDSLNFSTLDIRSLIIKDNYLFAGTDKTGIWKRSLSDIVSAVKDGKNIKPTKYLLLQNYPNPFNPSTVISYQLPVNSQVSLKIFNSLGQEIATLIDKEMSAGNYTQQWDAAGMPSGVYFYELQAENFIQTRKMIFMK